MYRLMAIFALSALMALPAEAELQTVRLSVPGMTCPACPITVKKALSRVPGVNAVTVNFEKRQATVEFDDIRTNVVALVRATGDAGYPSTALKTE
jgi:periplasmic mercuric ion binding protein